MRLKYFSISLLILMQLASNGLAQDQKSSFPEAIEDNSFFIEEAYNQEPRVVQHIFNFFNADKFSGDNSFGFTQEWPIAGIKHQLSYSLALVNTVDGKTGPGDFMVNYRYQLTSHDDFITTAPRLSVSIPSGDYKNGMGSNRWGLQFNLPVSKRWTNKFITHFNAGTTVLSKHINNDIVHDQTLFNYFTGMSVIWLAHSNFNVMAETLASWNAELQYDGNPKYTSQFLISPGLRYAINCKSLQIVPGVAVPISTTQSQTTTTGVFFYLSFEHPY